MTTEPNNDPELTDDDAAFLVLIRQTYDSYPSRQAPPIHASRSRRWAVPVSVAAAAVVIGVIGGVALLANDDAPSDQELAQEPTSSDGDSRVSDADPTTAREPLLVPEIAATWSQQTIDGCTTYEPGPSPQVVFVPRFSAECLGKVPFGSTVIFSSPETDQLGGVDWESASEAWTEIDGIQIFRKVRGEEFTISSTYIQGIWTDTPREYAVYVGERAVSAMEALSPEREVRTPDGESE